MPASRFVLCVEDEPDIGLLLERTLDMNSPSIEVVISPNGVDALEKMAERQPDLIVLDLMLPRISGWDFLEQVRANEKWRDIPVVILSVRGESEDRRRGYYGCLGSGRGPPSLPGDLRDAGHGNGVDHSVRVPPDARQGRKAGIPRIWQGDSAHRARAAIQPGREQDGAGQDGEGVHQDGYPPLVQSVSSRVFVIVHVNSPP